MTSKMTLRGWTAAWLLGSILVSVIQAADNVVASTAVYGRIGNGYIRERQPDGSFQPEYYALSNGGRIAGTASDLTVDKVSYPEVAEIAAQLLQQQNYQYAQSQEQAKLLIVLYWGNTIAPNTTNYTQGLNRVASALAESGPQGMGNLDAGRGGPAEDGGVKDDLIVRLLMESRARDQINASNARVLGYFDDINESNDIRRWAGGGDRYTDLIADVEETRYYVIISAYDFPQLIKTGEKKLLWQTRVSVSSVGNRFDDSVVAMMKSASKYFGKNSGRLVRGEELKTQVELGDLKFLGEAGEVIPTGGANLLGSKQ